MKFTLIKLVFNFILINFVYAHDLTVILENSGEPFSLIGYKMHLSLFRDDGFPLCHQPIPLQDIEICYGELPIKDHPLKKSQAKIGSTFTVPNIPYENNNEGLEENIYNQLSIIVINEENNYLLHKNFKLLNSTIPGSLKQLNLRVSPHFEGSSLKHINIVEILNLRFVKQMFEPEIDSSRYAFNEDINLQSSYVKSINFDRYFWYVRGWGPNFLMSHLRDVYRQDMQKGMQPILDEINFVERFTHIRTQSMVKLVDRKIFNNNKLLNVTDALYVMDGYGELRIIDPLLIPANYIKSNENCSDFEKFEHEGHSYYRLKGRRFLHSMLAASEAVACAGHISVKQGELIKIDENSGHYAPTTLQLLHVLDYLSITGGGIVRETTEVGYQTKNGLVYTSYMKFQNMVDTSQYSLNYRKITSDQ